MNTETSDEETVGIFKTVKNKKVIELLKKQGKNVIEFPELKIQKISINEEEKKMLEKITEFDWLIFTDVFSVDFFLEDFAGTGCEIYLLDEIKICSCGEAVADRLRFSQVHSDVIPPFNKPEMILQSISDYIFDEHEFNDSKFLVLKSDKEKSNLSGLLIEKKIDFIELSNHTILKNNSFENTKLILLLTEKAIDKFVFTSPEDFESIKNLVNETPLNELLDGIEIETADEITTVALRENGI